MYNLLYSTNTMKTVSASYARNNFQEIVNTAVYKNQSIIVTRRSTPLVVITPYNRTSSNKRFEDALKPALKLTKKISKQEARRMFREAKEQYE